MMGYKFEHLEVWQMAVEYTDHVYAIAQHLPTEEKYGLTSQITRAANSIALNIAEGSTSQSDQEQVRFLGYAIRSLIETVGCLHLIKRRGYLDDVAPLREAYRFSQPLFAKLQAFRNALTGDGRAHESEVPCDASTLGGPPSAVNSRPEL